MKKVLTLTFGEPFALQKVRTTSFIKILQGKVYYKAVEWSNSTYCRSAIALLGSARSKPQVESRSVDEILLCYLNVSFTSVFTVPCANIT